MPQVTAIFLINRVFLNLFRMSGLRDFQTWRSGNPAECLLTLRLPSNNRYYEITGHIGVGACGNRPYLFGGKATMGRDHCAAHPKRNDRGYLARAARASGSS